MSNMLWWGWALLAALTPTILIGIPALAMFLHRRGLAWPFGAGVAAGPPVAGGPAVHGEERWMPFKKLGAAFLATIFLEVILCNYAPVLYRMWPFYVICFCFLVGGATYWLTDKGSFTRGVSLTFVVVAVLTALISNIVTEAQSPSGEASNHPPANNNPPGKVAERPAFVPPPEPCDGVYRELPITSTPTPIPNGTKCASGYGVDRGTATVEKPDGTKVPVIANGTAPDFEGVAKVAYTNVPGGAVLGYTLCPPGWKVKNFRCRR